ncbi:hypothetical protein JXA47_17540, partial [Candidatus Sumerlaeota bacterium]|nr:hypothetical protein [Candidatus Sumerlaeota bacterium]
MSRLSLFVIPLWVALGACSLAQPGAETASAASEEPVMVAILWHQHQPHYLQDPETGEYTLPWVRMHAIKDYVDMITILDDHPDIHFTVNLTPVLIGQINDLLAAWDEGRPTDAFVRHTLLDADALTDAERDFIRRNFFSINWGRILERYPRYVELRDRREDPLDTWTAQDFRDLQMLFNLGWMDPDFHDGATLPDGTVIDVGDWIAQGRDFTEEDKAELIAMHFAILRQVIAVHRAAQDRGQIEVTTTPYYHPILPLICDTESAREGSPDITLPGVRFQRPADAALHVRRAVAQYEELFDRPPSGLWPAEGSVSQAIVPLLADAGLDWFASDVHVLARSIGVDDPPAAQRFSMWSVANPGGEPLAAVFRDTGLSDLIGFTYSGRNGTEAAEDFVG